MYNSYDKKMKNISDHLEKQIELFSIDCDFLVLESEKLIFDSKMTIKFLNRKIEYYKKKLTPLLETLEKENIEDIIEKTQFEIKYEERKYQLEIRKFNRKIDDFEYEIKKLQSELAIQKDRQLGLFD